MTIVVIEDCLPSAASLRISSRSRSIQSAFAYIAAGSHRQIFNRDVIRSVFLEISLSTLVWFLERILALEIVWAKQAPSCITL